MEDEVVRPRKLWAKALRSGEYKQCQGYLKTEEGHCCLGVACELYSKYVSPLPESTRNDGTANWVSFDDQTSFLPDQVMEWMGLVDVAGTFMDEEGLPTDLTIKNDSGVTFVQIADILEAKEGEIFKSYAEACE